VATGDARQSPTRGHSPHTELDRKFAAFLNIESSKSLWEVFSRVVAGMNYAAVISRDLKKNKSIVSRQLRQLTRVGLLAQTGIGVKQSFGVDWTTMTTFWLWDAEAISGHMAEAHLQDLSLEGPTASKWMKAFHLSEKRVKEVVRAGFVHEKLEPIVPQLAQIVQHVLQKVSLHSDVRDFNDAFEKLSLGFGVGLSEALEVNVEKIDVPATKYLFVTLQNPLVRDWFNFLLHITLVSSTTVKRDLLELAGVQR
jgi:hypothetical protein